MTRCTFVARSVALLVLAATGVAAQEPLTDSTCSYDRCALWLRGTQIRRGMPGERLSGGNAALVQLVQSSDSASMHVRRYVQSRRTSTWLMVAGAATSALGFYLRSQRVGEFPTRRDPTFTEAALMFGGVAAVYVSLPFEVRAQRSLQRTIWWYNRDLPR